VTLVEATVVLAVVSVLAAALAPGINGYIEQARLARAHQDVRTIADAIQAFIADNAEHQFLIDGSNGTTTQPPTRFDNNRVNLLVSDGDIPSRNATLVAGGETFWTGALDGAEVDTFSNHLIENSPVETAGNRYRTATDITVSGGGNNIDFARASSAGFNAPYSWRGPYLRGPVGPDPWGNRYAANVVFLDPAPTTAPSLPITSGFSAALDYPRLDVFVLSAGPDEEIDTPSGQDGAVPGDDDIIAIVSSHAK
jgi:type II secretory pathway pseudopilin PulG